MARGPPRVGLASSAEYLQDVTWFRALGVFGIGSGIEHTTVAIDYVRRRNRESPGFVPIGEWQVDEGAAVDGLLVVGNPVDESELAGELVAGIAQEREAELMLVVHEERLLDSLRRDGDQ